MHNKQQYLGLLLRHLYKDKVEVTEDYLGLRITRWDVTEVEQPVDLDAFLDEHEDLINQLVGTTQKNIRNRLLRSTDWTQLPDTPEEEAALWADYRRDLWDIDKQEGFPYDIEWPVPPV